MKKYYLKITIKTITIELNILNCQQRNKSQELEKLGLILAMYPTYEIYFRNKGETYDVMRVDPLLGVYAAVNHPNPKSRITPFEALKMYTINGAYSVIEDDIIGIYDLRWNNERLNSFIRAFENENFVEKIRS